MNPEFARLIVNSAMKISTELESIVPLLKVHASSEEEKELTSRISTTIEQINTDILQHIYEKFPEIEQNVHTLMDKFGRIA